MPLQALFLDENAWLSFSTDIFGISLLSSSFSQHFVERLKFP
jgi:hypothetical protein